MFRTLLVVLALLGQSAAACPVAEDLDVSVSVIFDDGITEVYRRSGTGVIAVEGRVDGTVIYRMQLAQGVHLLRYEDVEGGQSVPASLIVYDYEGAANSLPVPRPGGRWQADVTVTRPEDRVAENQSQVYGEETTIEIGGCRYDAIPVTIAYDTPGGYLEALVYMPELGIAILDWSQTGDEDAIPVTPLSISRGK